MARTSGVDAVGRYYDMANSLGIRLKGTRARRSMIQVVECAWCSTLITIHGQGLGAFKRDGSALCSSECRRNQDRVKSTKRKMQETLRKGNSRRSRLRAAAIIEAINVEELAQRDRRRCHVCGLHVDMAIRDRGPESPTIDHIIPLSQGGDHSWANVALAHKSCNSRRAALGGGEQLMLIGRW